MGISSGRTVAFCSGSRYGAMVLSLFCMVPAAAPRIKRQKPIPLIAGRHFKGYGDLEKEINRIRQQYDPHDTPMQGHDARLVTEWMAHHEAFDEAVERHGPLRHIEVRWNPGVYKAPCRPEYDRNQLTLVFADGFTEPFGYQASKNLFGVIPNGYEKHATRWRWIKTAGRCLIADDIREFRDNHLDADGYCEISGTLITLQTVEIHHSEVPFGWMLFGFLRDHFDITGQDAFDVEVVDTDTVGGKRFADDDLCDAWVQHHCQQAQLQALDAKVHRQQHVGLEKPPYLKLFNLQ